MSGMKEPDQAHMVAVVGDHVSRAITVHTNIAQEMLVISEDKVKLTLIKHQERLGAHDAWIAPASILLTIIITFATADFHSWLLPAADWTAIFIVSGFVSAAWLLLGIRHSLQASSVEQVLADMKAEAHKQGQPAPRP